MPYKICERCGQNMCYPRGGTPRCICKKPVPVATVRNEEAEIVGKQVAHGDDKGNTLSGLRKGSFRDRAAGRGRRVEVVQVVRDEKEDAV